jgi:hypothetical protein
MACGRQNSKEKTSVEKLKVGSRYYLTLYVDE